MLLTGSNHFKLGMVAEFLDHPDPYGIRSCGVLDTIIDLGAQCGLFSLMARFLYPDARIIGIEPDPENFSAYVINVQHLRIEPHHLAIGPGGGTMAGVYRTVRSGEGSRQFRTPVSNDTNPDAVPGYSLGELWKAWKPEGKIFLKCDIEGAEHTFVHDSVAEVCIQTCMAVGAELHAGNKVESGMTMAEYSAWVEKRFKATHDISLRTFDRQKFGDLRMARKE